MKKLISKIALAAFALIAMATPAHAQVFNPNYWSLSSGNLSPIVSSWGLTVGGLTISSSGSIINGQVIPRMGTYAAYSSVVPLAGENIYLTDTGQLCTGDGNHSIANLFCTIAATSTTGYYGVDNRTPVAKLDIGNTFDVASPNLGDPSASIMNSKTGSMTIMSGTINDGGGTSGFRTDPSQTCLGDIYGTTAAGLELCSKTNDIVFLQGGNIIIDFNQNDSTFGAQNNLHLVADGGLEAATIEGIYGGFNLNYPIFGIGTTSMAVSGSAPANELTVEQTTAPQIAFSDKAGVALWTMRNAGGNFYIAPTNVSGTATTTTAIMLQGSNNNVGIGSTTPFASLSIKGTPSIVPFQIGSSTNAVILQVNPSGHIFASTTKPTVSSGSVDGTDLYGRVLGATSPVTITWFTPYTKVPVCVVSPEGGSVTNTFSYTPSATTLVVTETGLGTFDYDCHGQ